MLLAADVTKRYGPTTAVDNLNLHVDRGEVLCLLGANGAGKTTTVRLFLGFTSPDEGEVSVDGIDPAEDPVAARAAIAYIPENVMLYEELTGLENLAAFAGLYDGTLRDGAALLDAVGLAIMLVVDPLHAPPAARRRKDSRTAAARATPLELMMQPRGGGPEPTARSSSPELTMATLGLRWALSIELPTEARALTSPGVMARPG